MANPTTGQTAPTNPTPIPVVAPSATQALLPATPGAPTTEAAPESEAQAAFAALPKSRVDRGWLSQWLACGPDDPSRQVDIVHARYCVDPPTSHALLGQVLAQEPATVAETEAQALATLSLHNLADLEAGEGIEEGDRLHTAIGTMSTTTETPPQPTQLPAETPPQPATAPTPKQPAPRPEPLPTNPAAPATSPPPATPAAPPPAPATGS